MRFVATMLAAGSLFIAGCTQTIEGAAIAEGERPIDNPSKNDAASGAGTRDDPVPIGTAFQVGADWRVTILSYDSDAWPEIQAENQFNEAPKAGRSYVMAKVKAEYLGTKSGNAWLDLSNEYLGTNGVTSGTSMDDWCGVIPDDLSDAGTQFPNSTVEGNLCWAVDTDVISGGFVVMSAGFFGDEQVFFRGVD